MAVTKPEIDEVRQGAAEMYVRGKSITAIAKRYDVSRITVYRWLHRADVAAYIRYLGHTRTARTLPHYDAWVRKAVYDENVPAAVKFSIWKQLREEMFRLGEIPGASIDAPEVATEQDAEWKADPWAYVRGQGKATQ
jgi:hypothetical protein